MSLSSEEDDMAVCQKINKCDTGPNRMSEEDEREF
jgi:hypothetical protein